MTAPTAKIVRRFVAAAADPGGTDRDLLRRFAGGHDAEAFEVVVRRHGAMVLAVARRVVGNAHDAEDVCQAAFLLLAQKAGGRWHPSVANWLHQTAHLLALKARRTAGRRAAREARAAKPAASLATLTGQELLAALDEELLALPESLRAPLVLCYLEGSTRDEAAERLACPLSTLKKRLERGRARLHDTLVRRGLSLSAALAVLLVGSPAAALPAHITRVALGGAVPERVGQLLKGGISMNGGTTIKAVLGVLVLGGLLAAAGPGTIVPGPYRPLTPPLTAQPPVPPKPAEQTAGTMRVVVLDPQGKPVAGATVFPSIWTEEKDYKTNVEVKTDDSGVAVVLLPKTYTIVRVWASKPPFASLHTSWEQGEVAGGKGLPAEYTFRMERTTTAGGRVVDEKGRPIAGAKVDVNLANSPKPAGGDGRVGYSYSLASGKSAATTDADGRWRIDNVPDHPEVELSLLVSHPDFVGGDGWRRAAKEQGITQAALRNGTATFTLKAGVIVRGVVTDPDGKPVKDALVIHGDDSYRGHATRTFSTDAEGRYRLPALPAKETSLTVIAPGWAPQLRKVDLKPDTPPQDFRMAAGKPVRLRIVDAAGKPVPKASVFLLEWKGNNSIYTDRNPNHPKVPETGIPGRADADGVWLWPSAPDGPVKIHLYGKGTALLEMEVTGGATDQTVTLKAEHRITGAVADATTGKPIPAFAVIPIDVFGKDFLSAERFNAVTGKNGRLDFLADRTDIPLRVRIEALGYRSQTGPEFRVGDDTGRTQDFKLVPSKPITGVVADAGGKPVVKAAVFLATPTDQVRLSDGESHRVFTDAAGRFTFPDPGEPFAVVVQADAGFAQAEFVAGRSDVGTLTPRAWASVSGTFRDGGKPVAGATVLVNPIRVNTLDGPRVVGGYETTTGPDGGFSFPRVPAGPVAVRVHLGPWSDPGFRSGPHVPLNLKPGESVNLELGSGGATLTGRVKLTGKVPADLDCTYSLNYLVRLEPGIAPPPDVAAAGFDARKGWRDAWHDTPEGLAYLSTLRKWFVKLAPDGSFRVSGVPPGQYDLAVAVYAKPSGCLVDALARRVVRVSVTGTGEVKVPDVTAEVVPIIGVGDTPAVAFTQPDGKAGALADHRGKITVVHFWASWCAPCKKDLPPLKKLHERYFASDVAVVSLSLDEDAEAWRAALRGAEMQWPQGKLNAGVNGVSGVPAYWLLDANGKIVAKPDDLDALAKAIDDRLKK